MIRFILLLISINCFAQTKPSKDELIEEYYTNCALKYNYNYYMFEWQECLSNGLKKDSTISTFWQQKAMPYFKARKYEAGMVFLDKAVKYDSLSHLPYRGFIKCIFSKQYSDAIQDLELCYSKWKDGYVMDHSFLFYIGLSYLQLNDFEKADYYLTKTVNQQKEKFGEAHYLDIFYLGITKMELRKFEEAIALLDKTLEIYPEFPNAWYYKSICSYKLDKDKLGDLFWDNATKYAKEGYTNNEDNVIYEPYPYDIKF